MAFNGTHNRMPRRLVSTCLTVSSFAMACALAGCASVPDASQAADAATIEGVIVSIDTQPWTYDGNAVVVVDSQAGGRVSVHLPARWNLCAAPPVDIGALAVGQRVQASGAVAEAGVIVVCADAAHRLVPAR